MKGKIFITGKIIGEHRGEMVAKFMKAEIALKKLGWQVVNPMDLLSKVPQPWSESIQRVCRMAVKSCTAIYVFEDTVNSADAMLDLDYALANNLSVYYELENVETYERVNDLHSQK